MEPRKERVRYAVVGAGHLAQVAVLPAFQHAQENSELVALVSSSPEKRATLGRKYGLEHTGSYDELERVLRDSEADAVYITLPNAMHREFTERSARANVHVLCEKPMAMTEDDCRAMIATADQNSVFLMIAYRLHFEEATLSAMDVARSHRIGEPRMVNSVFSQQVPPGDIRTRADLGGGALFDIGIYCVNSARHVFQDEPNQVFGYQAKGRDDRSRGVDEMTGALLRFSGDRIGQFVVNQAAARVSMYRLIGTRGDLRVEPAYEYATALAHHLTVDGVTQTRQFPERDQFATELTYFSRCIKDGTEPEPDGWEGLADVRVMVAIQKSAQSGRPMTLAPFERRRRVQSKHGPAHERPTAGEVVEELRRIVPSHVNPVDAFSAIMCTFTERLTRGEATHVLVDLPIPMSLLFAPCVLHREEPARTFDRAFYLESVAEHLNLSVAEVTPLVRTVLSWVKRRLSPDVATHVAAQLPADLELLWREASETAGPEEVEARSP